MDFGCQNGESEVSRKPLFRPWPPSASPWPPWAFFWLPFGLSWPPLGLLLAPFLLPLGLLVITFASSWPLLGQDLLAQNSTRKGLTRAPPKHPTTTRSMTCLRRRRLVFSARAKQVWPEFQAESTREGRSKGQPAQCRRTFSSVLGRPFGLFGRVLSTTVQSLNLYHSHFIG